MAGAGYKLFNTGDVLLASEVNTYLMQQTVMSFADSTARTTALSGVLAEGMVSYLRDTNVVEIYNGSAWASLDDPNAIQNTIVDAKGDIVAASGNDTPARLAVGADGTTIVADSSTTTGLAYIPTFFAGKNKIINGDFGIWQRGTSITVPASTTTFTTDRFYVFSDHSSGTASVSRQTFTPGTAPVAGYEGSYFARWTQGTGATYWELAQKIEDVRTYAGQTVTFSFWAKASASASVNLIISQIFGSGGSSPVTVSGSASITTSWARYSATLNVPSISGKTIGTGSSLQVYINQSTPVNALQIDLWGWQVEAGSVATAFQTATGTIQGELAACQRYFELIETYQAAGSAQSTSAGYFNSYFKVTKRTSPTLTFKSTTYAFDVTGVTSKTGTAQASTVATPALSIWSITGSSGLTVGQHLIWTGGNIFAESEL